MVKNPNEPKGAYHPGPGTAHEVGVMIGFMAAFVLITVAYLMLWRLGNSKGEAKERLRREDLQEKLHRPRNTRVFAVHDMDRPVDRDSVSQGF
ncbi:MAG: hypothetical protein OHK93_008741 [Ramalina farinacea]|uniref:Uncharacterized protein n=1 Tax=Ramalina farinacea TaxID=258253 RepID=A0AA43QN03_9LECA|nr:hypothetical protein [Ramalina farinacea]